MAAAVVKGNLKFEEEICRNFCKWMNFTESNYQNDACFIRSANSLKQNAALQSDGGSDITKVFLKRSVPIPD